MTTPSPSPSDFRDDEIQAAEALLVLFFPRTKPSTSSRFPRWGTTRRRRSALKTGEENKPAGIERLSPSTPLSFSLSNGEETPPPPALPPRPPPTARIFKNKEQHKEWVKEQSERIATLSATKAALQQCVSEVKSRYQTLREANSWLKELQSKLRETMVQRQRKLHLFPVGPACTVGHQQQQQLQQRRWQLDMIRRTAEEEASEWRWRRQQQAAAYAQARKRRIELQRVKSSFKIQRLR